MFPNRRSALISIAVVAFLLMFAGFAIDQNNVSRLKRYRLEADAVLETVMEGIDERFTYALTLASLLEDDALTAPMRSLLEPYSKDLSPSTLSELYVALDKELAVLQKKIFIHEQYPLYAAYFEKIYETEQALAEPLDGYNEKARFYNAQIGGFLASYAAKRLEMEGLELFSVTPAMKGRP
ncbi:MAG: hypothetical protein RBR15_17110 [Sphaerochaeta sp.]|nr:hypothetical protein [Sphaerochaeta sp.]